MQEFLEYLPFLFTDRVMLNAIATTFQLALISTSISTILGIIFGLLLERNRFPGKGLVIRINRTLMGMPPVVIGLITYLLLMRRGPLGFLSLLFTMGGMAVAQILIITPIISGMVYTAASRSAPNIRAFAKTMGATKSQTALLIIKELRHEIYFAIIAGFGRSISEVGAVMMVGGNIANQTRTMTTAISTLSRQGIFQEGIILGATLLIMAFILQTIVEMISKKEEKDENY